MTLPPSLFELLKLELFPLFLISASAFPPSALTLTGPVDPPLPPEPPYAVGFAVKLLLVVFATAAKAQPRRHFRQRPPPRRPCPRLRLQPRPEQILNMPRLSRIRSL